MFEYVGKRWLTNSLRRTAELLCSAKNCLLAIADLSTVTHIKSFSVRMAELPTLL